MEQKRRLVKAFRRRSGAGSRRTTGRSSPGPGSGPRARRRCSSRRRGCSEAGARGERPREVLKPRTCYVCKAEFTPPASLLRRALPRLRRAELREALPDRGPARARGPRHGRPGQDRLPGRAQAAPGRRHSRRHHALPARRRRALRARARLRRVERPAPHPRPRPAPLAERRDLRAPASSTSSGGLDLLVNNACQTVRRPPGFYAHLARLRGAARIDALPPELRPLVASTTSAGGCSRARGPKRRAEATSRRLVAWRGGRSRPRVCATRRACRRCATPTTTARAASDLFPDGATRCGPPAGRPARSVNTWRLTLAEVPTAGDARGPARERGGALRPVRPAQAAHAARAATATSTSSTSRPWRAVFSRGTKTDKHPHTNMAKAALNMLTLTVGAATTRATGST